mgnify:FL=1
MATEDDAEQPVSTVDPLELAHSLLDTLEEELTCVQQHAAFPATSLEGCCHTPVLHEKAAEAAKEALLELLGQQVDARVKAEAIPKETGAFGQMLLHLYAAMHGKPPENFLRLHFDLTDAAGKESQWTLTFQREGGKEPDQDDVDRG